MAQGTARRNRPAVEGVEAALNKFKYEVAAEIGIQVPENDYWGNLTSRDCGAVGGNMVRKMIQQAEQSLAGTLR